MRDELGERGSKEDTPQLPADARFQVSSLKFLNRIKINKKKLKTADRARDHSTADATAASIALLLHLSLPRLLFARTQRRGVNWKTIVAKRAERFLNGDWQALWNEATPAEYSVHSYAELSRQQLEALAQERGNHGDIKGAAKTLCRARTCCSYARMRQWPLSGKRSLTLHVAD